MNVYLYVSLVTLLGVVVSVYAARIKAGGSMLAAVVLYGVLSIALGFVLTIPMLQLVSGACSLLRIVKETSCIATDERTVWYLAVPLVAFPLYFIVMLVSRPVAPRRHGGDRAATTVIEGPREASSFKPKPHRGSA